MIDPKELENRFTYHAPKAGQNEKYQDIRHAGHIMGDPDRKALPGEPRGVARPYQDRRSCLLGQCRDRA